MNRTEIIKISAITSEELINIRRTTNENKKAYNR